MNAVDNQLEAALATRSNRSATSGELKAAADHARGFVRELDAESERGPQREAEILAAMTSTGIQKTIEALASLDSEGERRAHLRKAATALGAQIDARASDVAKAETERDERRRPMAAETRRATDLAEKVRSVYALAAARIVDLLRDDVLISGIGKSAYGYLPPPSGTHVSYVRTWHVPRILSTDAIMTAIKLPDHWPPRFSDFSILEQRHFEEDDSEIIRPLRSLINKRPLSESEVDAAIARAHGLLLAEYRKAVDAIEGLLRLDATVTAADREVKYQDHGLVFDPALFPSYWIIGRMRQRIALPPIGGLAVAAE
jgi:hypothetical protein